MWPEPASSRPYSPPSPEQVRRSLIAEARRNRERAARLREEAQALDAEADRIMTSLATP